MKKKILAGTIMILSFCLVGCGNQKQTVVNCELSNDSTAYKLNATYKIYSKGNVVQKVVTKEVATSDDENILDTLEKTINDTYENANKSYGGYKFTVKKDDNKITSNVTIDYNKMNFSKYVKENAGMKSFVNKKNRLTTEGAKKIYTSMGATCK